MILEKIKENNNMMLKVKKYHRNLYNNRLLYLLNQQKMDTIFLKKLFIPMDIKLNYYKFKKINKMG